jgi:hypothetical protein
MVVARDWALSHFFRVWWKRSTVGEVGLPAFVGLVGGEPDVEGFRAFLGGGGDQAGGGQMSVDGADRDGDVVVVGQVPGNGLGSVVEAFARQLRAQRHNQSDGVFG